jgi:hypothetical protein
MPDLRRAPDEALVIRPTVRFNRRTFELLPYPSIFSLASVLLSFA